VRNIPGVTLATDDVFRDGDGERVGRLQGGVDGGGRRGLNGGSATEKQEGIWRDYRD
jgi:hypothetical protein